MVVAWAFVSLWSGALYLRAALDPPPGTTFAGTFHWIDDFYNYASYVQQAEDHHFFFRNKLLAPSEARPQLVNVEWWTVGLLSRALGRRPLLAYRVFALLATLALVAGIERWLNRLGAPPSHRLPLILLALFGGGLGGLLFELSDLPVHRCVDLHVALFPFFETLANPHFTAGTALLLWSLWCFSGPPRAPRTIAGVALGTLLGLARPYDLGLLGLVGGLAVLGSERPARWPRALAPLCGLLPVLAYDLWLFFGSRQFALFQRGGAYPSWLDFAPAIGPALLLALVSLREPAGTGEESRARLHLWLWAGAALVLIAARPGGFSLQFLVGAGLPLLLLGGAGLRRASPALVALLALAFSSSAVVASRIALSEDPNWFVPRARVAAALALRADCGTADRVLAPPDIGLYAIGLTSCHAFVSHPAGPGYAAAVAETRAFYTSMSSAQRRALLAREGLTRLVLPRYDGLSPDAWLGPGSGFRALATLRGDGATVYGRDAPPGAAGIMRP